MELSITDIADAESLDRYLRGLKRRVKAQVLLQKPIDTEDTMRVAEIYDPLVVNPSKKHGARLTHRAAPAGEAMDVDVITHDRPTKMNRKLKEQLMEEGKCFFCRKAGHLTKTCPEKVVLGSKPKNNMGGINSRQSYSHLSNWPCTGALETPLPEDSDSSEELNGAHSSSSTQN